jgi:propanol-preferring alcohol dehydrogenase
VHQRIAGGYPMKAVRAAAGGGVIVEDVPEPDPGPGQVLIEVAGAGLCHSDVTISRVPQFYGGGPFTLGHETGGRVAGWGPGVTGLEMGMPVVAHAEWGCGQCPTCRQGHERLCPEVAPVGGAGLGADGGMARYLLVPAARYVVPLRDLDPRDAGPLDDAALTPYHAVRTAQAELGPGAVAVVIGAGGLGHMAVQILKAVTPATVVVVEPDATRRAFATEVGADRAVHPDDDVAGQVRGLRPRGASVVFDLVGTDTTLALAASMASPRGRVILIGAALGSLTFNLLALPWECRLHTCYAGEPRELEEVVALAEAGRIRVHTRHLPLDDVPGAIAALDRGDHGAGRMIAIP